MEEAPKSKEDIESTEQRYREILRSLIGWDSRTSNEPKWNPKLWKRFAPLIIEGAQKEVDELSASGAFDKGEVTPHERYARAAEQLNSEASELEQLFGPQRVEEIKREVHADIGENGYPEEADEGGEG